MKKILLTQEQCASVDDSDYERLNQWKWQCDNKGYARRTKVVGGKKIAIMMHREINNTPSGLLTDHINGNKLDNRKSNLRTVTNAQNSYNSQSSKNSTSRFKGVHVRHGLQKTWQAQIKINGITQFLGTFKTELEAAKAYNVQARKCFGGFAKVNNILEGGMV